MKRIQHIIIALIFTLCATACERDLIPGGNDVEGVDVLARLNSLRRPMSK